MDPLTISTAIAGFLSLATPFAKVLKDYIGDAKAAPKEARDLLIQVNLLSQVLQQFTQFLVHEGTQGQWFDLTAVLSSVIRLCQQQIERLHQKLSKAVATNPFWKMIRGRLKWPFETDECRKTIQSLHHCMQAFEFSLSIQNSALLSNGIFLELERHRRLLQQTEETLQRMLGSDTQHEQLSEAVNSVQGDLNRTPDLSLSALGVHDIITRMEKLEQTWKGRDMEELVRLLSPLEGQKRHSDIRTKRFHGTGTWLLGMPEFETWRDGVGDGISNVLVCYGNPGAGKTVLCSLVIDHLSERFAPPAVTDVGISFLYCHHQEQDVQTPANIIGDLLKQFIIPMSSVPSTIETIIQKNKNEQKKLELADACHMLSLALASYTNTYICIDALDECVASHRKIILQTLAQISRDCPTVRIILTGRPTVLGDINWYLGFSSPMVIRIAAKQEDIMRFISHQLDDDTYRVSMDDDFKREVVTQITSKSQEIFLLAGLHIQAVLNEPTISLRRKVLYEMPEDLQEAFTGTIDRIKRQPGSQPKQAMKILKWVYFAERPLNIKELRHAMAVNPGSVSYNLDFDALPSEESLLNCCLGLIVVDDRTFRVCLVHFALQEYFDVWHRVLFHAGHSDLAHSCLTYLSMDVFGVMAEQFERMGNAAWEGEWTYPAMYDFPFLTYAALNWGHHLRKQSDDSANELAISLLVGRVDYHCVTQVLGDKIVRSTSTGPGRIASLQFAGLHVAAFFGTSHVLHRLLNRPKQYADSKDRGGRTPLSYAAENGHQSVVKQLLCHAVNPNSRDAIYRRTPLSWASENGHQAVVQLLLEHCAVTSLNCSNGRAPISYAAAKGHKIVVQKLLDQNAAADSQRSTELPRKMRNKISFWWLNSTGFTAQTPLSLAAENGHKEIVQLLHSRGADADSRDNRGHSPVALAAQGGYEEIVQLLLDWGAESASRDYFGWTPLYHAAARGHTKVVQLLLDLNVEVCLTDCSLKTPMHWASKNGHEAVVQMLLMRGIDANLRDLGGQSATSLAASGGHLAVVRILLEQNVDPDSKHIEGRTPLSFAAEGGYTEIVQLLLQRGADADSRDIRDLSPLSWAAGRGNDAVVQVLLEYDVDIDSIDVVEGRTPLSRAAEIGSQAIVSQLLQRNAMSDSKDKRGRSPLSWAARRRHESVVQLLLERGASSNSKDNDGWSPIHWAGGNKDDPVVQLLLHRSDATGINDCWNPTLPYVGPYTDGGEILGGVEFILIPGQPGQINRINRIVTQDS